MFLALRSSLTVLDNGTDSTLKDTCAHQQVGETHGHSRYSWHCNVDECVIPMDRVPVLDTSLDAS